MRHATTAQAWDLAAELVRTHWMQLMIEGEMGALRPVIEAMPPERVKACPELALGFAGAYLARGDRACAGPYLRRAKELASQVPVDRRAQFAASMASSFSTRTG
jgi:ATP/maltotriose-dependent transcriptional regulator MalT